MRQTMANVHRMLKPGGQFVFAVPHPAFAFMREGAPPFYFDLGSAGYFSARDSVFSGRIWKRGGSALDVQLVHKTLQDYVEGQAGRREPSPLAPSVRRAMPRKLESILLPMLRTPQDEQFVQQAIRTALDARCRSFDGVLREALPDGVHAAAGTD